MDVDLFLEMVRRYTDAKAITERDILMETRKGVALGYAPSGIAV